MTGINSKGDDKEKKADSRQQSYGIATIYDPGQRCDTERRSHCTFPTAKNNGDVSDNAAKKQITKTIVERIKKISLKLKKGGVAKKDEETLDERGDRRLRYANLSCLCGVLIFKLLLALTLFTFSLKSGTFRVWSTYNFFFDSFRNRHHSQYAFFLRFYNRYFTAV